MDHRRFDTLTRALASPETRRRLLGDLATVPVVGGLAGILSPEDVDAKDRRRRRKQRHKRRKDPGSRKGKKGCKPKGKGKVCAGTCGPVKSRQTCGKTVDCGSCDCSPTCAECFTCQGSPGTCVPQQAGTPCGEADTCTSGTLQPQSRCDGNGVCQLADPISCAPYTQCDGNACASSCNGNADCVAGAICVDGACQTCDVTCTESASACGTALQAAFAGSAATLYVCPGEYAGGFSISRDVTVIGAGQGADPATDTILDGGGTQQVLDIPGSAVTLHRLRVRNGDAGRIASSGGILHEGGSLSMHDCTVTANRGRTGGGLRHESGSLTMVGCTVSDNTTPPQVEFGPTNGGGLLIVGSAILTDCQIIGNTDADGLGGGIYFAGDSSTLTLAGATHIAGNSARWGGGLYNRASSGSITIGEECRITGNTARSGQGGGVYRYSTGQVTLEGTETSSPIVTGNCHENCAGELIDRCASGGSCPD